MKTPGVVGLVLVGSIILSTGTAFGQDFEAASLRRVDSTQCSLSPLRGGPGSPDPGRITARCIKLRILLQRAYDLKADQVFGPAWIDAERYDLTATLPPDATEEQYKRMLGNLLAERFHLSLHHETRSFSGYQLVTAKVVTAKAGPRLKTANAGSPGCSFNLGNGHAHVTCPGVSMAVFADVLGSSLIASSVESNPRQIHVLDRTGLAALYNFTLDYSLRTSADSVPDGADLFTALQQQLGLKLEEAKIALDAIVIDQAEKNPTED